jgi:hypothetical protein
MGGNNETTAYLSQFCLLSGQLLTLVIDKPNQVSILGIVHYGLFPPYFLTLKTKREQVSIISSF